MEDRSRKNTGTVAGSVSANKPSAVVKTVPVLSIVIASKRPDSLSLLLSAIKEHTNNVDYEIILQHEDGGTVIPTNIGFNKAVGKYVVAIADDVLVTPDWAFNMIRFMDKQAHNVIGNFRMLRYEQGTKKVRERPMFPVTYYGKEIACFPFVRKDYPGTIGGFFDPAFSSFYADPDLSMRCWNSGGEVISCPDAFVLTDNQIDDLHKHNFNKHFEKDELEFIRRYGKIRT